MKIRLIALVIICLLSSFALAQEETVTPTATFTATPVGNYVVRADIYVRGGPGERFLPVGRLVAGNTLEPLSRNAAGTWVLIAYGRGFGWIRRDLAYWAVNIDVLPVFDESNLTPTTLPGSETPTPFFVTPTATGNWVNVGPQGAFIRSGPGAQYDILGELEDGDPVEPVGRDADGEWILIRFNDGFAWISRPLVHWVDDLRSLPVLLPSALTPSPTFTGTLTPTSTPTASETPTNTLTSAPTETPTNTDTATPIPTNTATETAAPSATFTNTLVPTDTEAATVTPEPSDTATNTVVPSETPTNTLEPTNTATLAPSATETAQPSETPTEETLATAAPSVTEILLLTATNTPSATFTEAATNTPTDTPSLTATEAASNTPTNTLVPPTETEAPTVTSEPSDTATNTTAPSHTPASPSATPAEAAAVSTATPNFGVTATRIALETAVAIGQATVNAMQSATSEETEVVAVIPSNTITIVPTNTVTPSPTVVPDMVGVAAPTGAAPTEEGTPQPAPQGGRLPVELIVGIFLLVLVLGYVGLYWRGLASLERYANGFVIEQCPVCGRGQLMVETRQDRVLGIPRARTTVRCSVCRSVLREVGNRRWRYAVDRIENPALYERLNGKVVDEATLQSLYNQPQAPRPARPRLPTRPPKFEDDE